MSRRNTTTRRTLAALAAAVAGLSFAAPIADAVTPGRNGRIAFTSGRESGDAQARLYVRSVLDPATGIGELSPPFSPGGAQSRHAAWSPDRTKVVFAQGTPGAPTTEEYDLYIADMEAGTVSPLDVTQVGDGLSSDHPAWSPDGTRIAYEHQVVDNNANRDVMVKTFPSSAPAVALTTTPDVELKPAFSPDSQTLYYAKRPQVATADYDIVRQPAAGGPETPVAAASGVDEYQPSISPDGSKICFTLQTTPGNASTADIYTASLAGLSDLRNLSTDVTKGDINCAWSPDGMKIAYVNGVFNAGRLVMKDSDNPNSTRLVLEEDPGSDNFDGNPDWAPDGDPDCPDTAVTTRANTAITIPLRCVDTGPAYERTNVLEFVRGNGGPASGTLSNESPTTEPATVTYTPSPGFTGTDRIVYGSVDGYGPGRDTGVVSITVTAPTGGGGGGGGGGVDRVPPAISGVALSRTTFAIGRRSTAVAAARPRRTPQGTTIRYSLSEPARVTLAFSRAITGRRVGPSCRPLTQGNRRRRPCTRHVAAGTLRRASRRGANRAAFSGRIGRRALARGTYRLVVTAVDTAGNRSTARPRGFRIVR